MLTYIKTLIFALSLMVWSLSAFSQQYRMTNEGVDAVIDSVNVRITFLHDNIIRVYKYPERLSDHKREFSVIDKRSFSPVAITRKGTSLVLRSPSTTVSLNLKTALVSFYDSTGHLLLSEKKSRFSGPSGKYDVSQSFQLSQDEGIFGLGQHQDGIVNRRNSNLTLIQRNKEIALPFFLSTKGYGLFWDNYSITHFRDTLNRLAFQSEVGKRVDYFFIHGDNADRIIGGLRKLTGQAPMLPLWAFGYWQSRERYRSQEELVDVVKRYRNLGVPLDVIVQDWQYWSTDVDFWNAIQFGNPAFPNPKEMVDEVHKLNAHLLISVWPSFGPRTAIFQELKEYGQLFNLSTYPPVAKVYNAFDREARDIYWKHLNDNLFSLGIDGWWLDGTEPIFKNKEGKDDEGEVEVPSVLAAFRNAFPLATSKGVYNHQRKVSSQKRVAILTRSAFIGQQRYGTIVWSGDITSDWHTLRDQISAGLGFSISGIPYWTTDIGGFNSKLSYPNGVKDPRFKELYVRWLEFETFLPIMRSHGTNTPREIYQFGKEGEWAYDAIKRFINFRYRLLPYLYSNAWETTSNAYTMMRPLMMDYGSDRNVWNINDEYMFGPGFLVCPITDSMYTQYKNGKPVVDFKKTFSRSVYLPAGSKWFDFWSGEVNTGGHHIQKAAPIDMIPLYVKAGAIIPMGEYKQYSAERKDSLLEIRIYPGANGEFTLYEDEGNNYNYEQGEYALIKMRWNDAEKTLTLDDRIGSFPGMLKSRIFHIVLVGAGHGTGIDYATDVDKTVMYNGGRITLQL